MKILMVCLGNICRSPLAQGIMQKLAEQHDLEWHIDSAGTGSWHVGSSPDPRSMDVARSRGLDISMQVARQFHYPDFDEFDIIFAMDRSNYRDIINLAVNENEKAKVKLILNELESTGNKDVPDPYWDDDGFEMVYDMLHDACSKIIQKYT